MIYNTTLKCLEIYTTVSGQDGWYCLGANTPSQLNTKIVNSTDTSAKQTFMFQDTEEESILFNESQRGFYLTNMLQANKVNENTIAIKNFFPHTFRNVKVFYKNPRLAKAINIITFDEVQSLSTFEENFTFTESNLRFEDETGAIVTVTPQDISGNDYTLSIKVENDPFYNKIKTIKQKTFIKFHNYNRSGNWGITTAKRIRMYIPAFVNMAYLYIQTNLKIDLSILNMNSMITKKCLLIDRPYMKKSLPIEN